MTPQTTQSTFLQRALGRNYKWWYLITYEFKRSSGHFATFLFNSIVRAIEFLAVVYIWKLNNTGAEIITYLAIGRVFGRLLNSWLDGQISYNISKGILARYLLLPGNPILTIVIGDLGFNFVRQAINAIFTLFLGILIFKSDIILSLNFLYLIPFLIIALVIKTFFFEILGFLAFWLRDTGNTGTLTDALKTASGLLSGEIIPLFVLFSGFWNPIFWTPFTYFLHHPMQIYLGKYSPDQTVLVATGGITWCIVLYFLAKLVFKLGLKRNESVGL